MEIEKVQISKRLKNILLNLNIKVLITSDISYIDCDDDNENYITFSPKSKIENIKKDIWKRHRNKMRVGKFFKSVLFLKDSDIENLVNRYKTFYKIEMGNIEDIFNIVNGTKIHYYYQKENYVKGNGSSLHNSCMNNTNKDTLKLYINNPKKISLLIIKVNDKISGRALMWQTNKGIYIDRPYCRFDNDTFLFSLYAEKMNYLYYHKDMSKPMSIKLKIPKGRLPYLDTFKHRTTNILKNY